MATHTPQFSTDDPFGMESIPSLSFRDAPIGTTYTGTILSPIRWVQTRNFETQKPKVWDDGNPVMAAVIELEVQGEKRTVWAVKPSSMFAAIAAAQKEANAGPLAVGGTLAIRLIGTKPSTKGAQLNPAKQYAAKYTPPAATHGDVFGDAPTPPSPSVPPGTKAPVAW
jgi:hypothetical protein